MQHSWKKEVAKAKLNAMKVPSQLMIQELMAAHDTHEDREESDDEI